MTVMKKTIASIAILLSACSFCKSYPDATPSRVITIAASEVPTPPVRVEHKSCSENMAHVVGDYCRTVRQECRVWIDPPEAAARRCAEFYPTECLSKKLEHKDFCVDVSEYTAKNETLPMVNVDYYQAEKLCEADGKRLCKETEWELSCEGPQMFPYTTGLNRNCDVCNCDITHGLGKVGHLNDLRQPSLSLKGCVSQFGTYAQNGDVDEITVRDHSGGRWKNALKGGWWGPIRARCRPATVAHGDTYSDAQLGFRCCSDTAISH
jgi:formylglycine-generating enzyme